MSFKRLCVFLMSSTMVYAPIASSFAQGAPAGFMNYYFQEHDYGGQHCAGLTWHFDRVPQPDQTSKVSGPIWYEDGSGVSFARGVAQADGQFTLNVTTVSGNGPAGIITGQRMPDGSVNATAAGPTCFAGTYHIAPGQTSVQQ
jgi:hypothetical protein